MIYAIYQINIILGVHAERVDAYISDDIYNTIIIILMYLYV
jgi:hypothetical protein